MIKKTNNFFDQNYNLIQSFELIIIFIRVPSIFFMRVLNYK